MQRGKTTFTAVKGDESWMPFDAGRGEKWVHEFED